MMLAAPLAGYLALPALAGLLMMTAWHMSEPHKCRERMAGRPPDRVLLLLTMFLTVFSDLTVALGVGTALGLPLRLRRRDVPPAACTPPARSATGACRLCHFRAGYVTDRLVLSGRGETTTPAFPRAQPFF